MPAVWRPGCDVLRSSFSRRVPRRLLRQAFRRAQGPERGPPSGSCRFSEARPPFTQNPPSPWCLPDTDCSPVPCPFGHNPLKGVFLGCQPLRSSRNTAVAIQHLSWQRVWTEAPACSEASRVCLTLSSDQCSKGTAIARSGGSQAPAPPRGEHGPAREEPRVDAGRGRTRERALTASPLAGPQHCPH